MRELHVSHPLLDVNPGGQRLSARFRVGLITKTVWFRTPPGSLSALSDPFVPVALIPAMRRRWRLTIEGPVSQSLLDGAERVQNRLTHWYPKMRHVEIKCMAVPVSSPKKSGAVATFFSGGVDSFYTLQRHRDEITDLIFVHGLDVPLWRREERERIAASVRSLAKEEGLRLVEVETNLRQFGQPHVSWSDSYVGAALGAIALMLAPRFDRIFIPASVGADELGPRGSHPELDQQWSSGNMDVVHDGLEATRFEKIRAIADWPLIYPSLRVCYQKIATRLNCGRCRKCLWTMMMLEAAGCLDRIETFESRLNLRLLRRYPPSRLNQRRRFVQSIDLLEERGDNEALQNLLREMLDAGGRAPMSGRLSRLVKRTENYLAHLLPYGT